MSEKTKELLGRLQGKWEEARSIQNVAAGKRSYESQVEAPNGAFSWNNTAMVMLLDLVDGGGYEESGSIIGLTKDGRLMWEYQSHCSCNGFEENTSGCSGELPENPLSTKSFELREVPPDWEERLQASIEKLLSVV